MDSVYNLESDNAASKKWKKILYGGMQPGYADNHTDETFLEEMVMNANVVKRDTLTAMLESVSVAEYVCIVTIIASVWAYTLKSNIGEYLLLSMDALLLVFGFLVLFLTTGRLSVSVLSRCIFNVTFFVSGLYVLAPIYQTLTRSISSDSIWALTVFLLLIHLFLHDYVGSSIKSSIFGEINRNMFVQNHSTVANNISLNASIVASVLIASRLPSRLLVFALMLFSLELFLFSSLIVHCIKQYSVKLHLCVSVLLVGISLALIYPLHRLLFSLFVGLILFIVVACPYWLVKAQEYKFEIKGPWDEAKLCFDIQD
eukprot:TRINITY_DN12569_c0_g1_i1.p1 TRINITY_DN12569_c0_g1~~TRINITY_DN12569_c0_g1_i1.p1  ORF type:complete len:314 (+),score=35.32 TRINITY_DN12569_c0_g1_i1:290-1231(+)